MTEPTFLEAADRIGCRLCRDAVWAGGRCNWLGWSVVRDRGRWAAAHLAQDHTLGAGVAGVALFLAHHQRATGDPIARETLLGAMAQLDHFVGRLDPAAVPVGYFRGAAGVATAYFEGAEILGIDRWREAGLKLLRAVATAARPAGDIDVATGTAGLVPVLLRAASEFEQGDLTEFAVRHGRQLLAAGPPRDFPLGYGYGAGGVACALLDLHDATGEGAFAETAARWLGYEWGRFDAGRDGWPHLRPEPVAPCGLAVGGPDAPHPVAWCHGAPGVLAGLLSAHGRGGGDAGPALEAAVRITLRAARTAARTDPHFGLCHGQAGRAEVLLRAGEQLGRPELTEAAGAVARFGVEQYHDRREPWPCAVRGLGECPSLLHGLAGIGHFYLRMHQPDAVRPVLAPAAGVGVAQ
jgi:lantibiotic modifying enzyme